MRVCAHACVGPMRASVRAYVCVGVAFFKCHIITDTNVESEPTRGETWLRTLFFHKFDISFVIGSGIIAGQWTRSIDSTMM